MLKGSKEEREEINSLVYEVQIQDMVSNIHVYRLKILFYLKSF